MRTLCAVLVLLALPCWAQEEPAPVIETLSLSLTVDNTDGKVTAWLDSLRAREPAARAQLSDSTAVAWMDSVIAADTLGVPVIGAVTVEPDSLGGENWLVLRLADPDDDAVLDVLLRMTRAEAAELYGAIVRPDGALRMARAMAAEWYHALPRRE